MSEGADFVDITVRGAFQTVSEDTQVRCPRLWTVLQFKQHLHDVIPSKPDVKSQRLIFVGHILKDEKTVDQVLKERNTEGTIFFHLACATPQPAVLRNRNTDAASAQPATSSAGVAPAPSTAMPSPEAANAATQAYYAMYYQQQFSPAASSQDAASMYADYYARYMTYIQSMQHQQRQTMMANFPVAAAAAAAAGAPFVPGAAQQFAAAAAVPMQQQHQVMQNQPVQAAAGDAANLEGPGVNGAGAMAPGVAGAAVGVAEDGMAVDALERGYRLIRLFLLAVVIFMYSTLERFLVVIAVILFVMFIQMRRAQQHNEEQERERRREEERRRRAVEREQQGNNNDGEAQPEQVAAAEGDGLFDRPEFQEVRTGMQIFLSTCYNFVTTFFTSLVPENPPPVNVN